MNRDIRLGLEIVNRLGLHARAAAKLACLAATFDADLRLRREDEREANAKSIMSLMMLAATKGTRLELVARGADAQAAVAAIAVLVANRFDETE